MKVFFRILVLIPLLSFSQQNDIWYSFQDEKTELKGFKDANDSVVLPAKYGIFTVANKFDKIIAAQEFKDNYTLVEEYYLLKDGTKFGRDSLYVFDFSYPCESEGFIKFQDKKKGLVGFFNTKGKIGIPAEYSAVTQMRNGTFVALKNATKKYWNNNKHVYGCNHWNWNGGTKYLVDSTNTILIKNFKSNEALNFYSLKITDKPVKSEIRDSFLGVNGKYYSFINNKKEFELFFNTLLDNLSIESLQKNSYNEVVYSDKNGWNSKPKDIFLKEKGNTILKRFKNLKIDTVKYSINIDDYTPNASNLEYLFEKRKNNCGDLNTSKYPIINVLVNYYNKNKDFLFQDHYDFIKINNKYRLLSVTVRDEE